MHTCADIEAALVISYSTAIDKLHPQVAEVPVRTKTAIAGFIPPIPVVIAAPQALLIELDMILPTPPNNIAPIRPLMIGNASRSQWPAGLANQIFARPLQAPGIQTGNE